MAQKNHSLKLFLMAATLLAVTLSACKQGGPPEYPAPAKIGVVGTETWQLTYVTTGTVEANEKVDLNSEVAGTIVSINFREGQHIGKGQTLIRLKGDKYAAQVSSARGEVTVQNAEIDRLQNQLEAATSRKKLAESEFKKFQKLYTDQFISGSELDTKRTELDTANADYNAALSAVNATRAMKSKAQADYRYSQALAGESVIRAPFGGVIGQKYVAQGDYVLPGEKIVTVVDNSVLKITFTVPERYLGYIHTGMPVLVYTEANPKLQYQATVNFVDPVVDLDSRTLTVKAVISDPQHQLKHGQSALAKLVLNTFQNAVVIPEEAVTLQGERPFVYTVNAKNKAHLQPITIGSRDEGKVQVTKGIKKGDHIVLSGLQKVYDGATIMEVKDEQPAAKKSKE